MSPSNANVKKMVDRDSDPSTASGRHAFPGMVAATHPPSLSDETVESYRLCAESNDTITRFVMVEIETAQIFCQIAAGRQGGNRTRILERARRAVEVAEDWIWKLKIPHAQFDQITAQLERIRFELEIVTRSGKS